MQKRILKKFLIITLILIFAFSPVSPLKFFSQKNNEVMAREHETISDYYKEWTEDREIDGSVTIDENTTLVIKKGVKITFKKNSTIYVNGKLFVKGTKEEPVKFSMDGVNEISFEEEETIEYYGYRIIVSGEAVFKNVDFSGGGDIFQYYLKGNSILNQAYAADHGGVVVAQGGKINVSDCYFHDNVGGVQIKWVDEGNNVEVHKTIFEDNYSFDAKNDSDEVNPDFRYNWWRGPDGPEIVDAEHKIYKYISGKMDFSNWLTSRDFKDPVIIIPGILGSEKEDGIWRMDPVFHTYDNLYGEFANNGYVPYEDLFTFPCEWRDSNVDNAKLLKNKIAEIKEQKNWPGQCNSKFNLLCYFYNWNIRNLVPC